MGRGMSGGSGMGGGSGQSINVVSTEDVWTYRHNQNNEPFVDAINTGIRTIQDDFPSLMDSLNTVDAAELGGRDKNHILGFYAPGQKQLAINQNFTNIDKMNATMDEATRQGYHPSRGNKTGTEAVTLHEAGHALTDHVAGKMGKDFDKAAADIVHTAMKNVKFKGGSEKFARQISGYAKKNYAECIAEAVADYYCNGSKASSSSKAIMSELRKYK